uniref:Fe2OG dioxygenase domain-containing protein n=1 Tax=Amphora coffeiformis TaxID=265554 RepID=A0A7S3KW25_9STRA
MMKRGFFVPSFKIPKKSLCLWRYIYCYCLATAPLTVASPTLRPFASSTTTKIMSTTTTEKQENEEDDPWQKVGGIAVNEKKRRGVTASDEDTTAAEATTGFDPIRHKAHLYHALEGLERYPRYLSRWNDDDDIDRLEAALQVQIEKVRSQRNEIHQHRAATKSLVEEFLAQSPEEYRTLLQRPDSWDTLKRDILDHGFSRAVEESAKRRKSVVRLPWDREESSNGDDVLVLEAAQLEPLMEQEVSDVYSVPLFQPAYCQRLMAFLCDLSAFRKAKFHDATSSLHTRWIDLDHVGLSWLNDILLHMVVQPISRHLFVQDTGNAALDWRQGYLAAYTTPTQTDQIRPRQGLTAHTDDSELTLNLSLNGGAFQGGDLDMYGLRGTRDEGQYQDTYTPLAGRALLHAGRYLHSVTELEAGDRFALILWTRSWRGIRADTCPCCWLQRRGGNGGGGGGGDKKKRQPGDTTSCICGAVWN